MQRQTLLKNYLSSPHLAQIKEKLVEEMKHHTIYPHPHNIFAAFEVEPKDIEVVILGQDPYHGPGQAHGLSFSVPDGISTPPSLENIFKEIEADIGCKPTSACLTGWREQGVFLLNSILTVRAHQAASHQSLGRQEFTDNVISELSTNYSHIVFMLRGNYARSKKTLIDTSKHYVLEAPHPSPLSAHRGFFGCKHFSLANIYLEKNGKRPIEWCRTTSAAAMHEAT